MKFILNLVAVLALAIPATAQVHQPDATADATVEATAQATCPISGEPLEDRDTFVDYEGQRIYVCCKKCVKKFKSFPDKWISQMEANSVALENTQTVCPVSGEELDEDAVVLAFGNKTIKVCCKKCARKVKATPATYFDKLEGRKAQEKCAVMGGKIIPKNAFGVNGTFVNQCCPGCEKKWRADSKKYFSKLAAEKVVLQPVNGQCAVHPNKKAKPEYFATLGARRFYFASADCQSKFLKDPTPYLKAMPDVAKGELPEGPLFPKPKAKLKAEAKATKASLPSTPSTGEACETGGCCDG